MLLKSDVVDITLQNMSDEDIKIKITETLETCLEKLRSLYQPPKVADISFEQMCSMAEAEREKVISENTRDLNKVRSLMDEQDRRLTNNRN